MLVRIECKKCGALLGTIDKSEITEQDIIDYEQMFLCDCGELPVVEIISE